MAQHDYYAEQEDYYNSAQEFLEEEDLIETDVKIEGWKKKFRIRALTLGQAKRITQKSTKDGVLDEEQFIKHSVLEGVIRPRFNQGNIDKLTDKNADLAESLSDAIWNLGRIGRDVFDKYIEARKAADDSKPK